MRLFRVAYFQTHNRMEKVAFVVAETPEQASAHVRKDARNEIKAVGTHIGTVEVAGK